MYSTWESAVEKVGLKSDSKVKAEFFISKHLGEGSSNSLQYFCLGNPMDRGTWRATVHGVTKSQTRLGD